MKRQIIVSVIGNILEWYDFTVFAFLAPVISQIFFPSQNAVVALIKTFGIFAVGFLARPLGGLLFGHLGDKYGRNTTLRLSVFMMAIPTTLIGLIPGYAKIGMLAPVILLLLRIVQGVSAGGELMGSVAYLYEIAPKDRRGFWASWSATSSIAGVFTGSLVAAFLHAVLSHAMLMHWGWRIPFLCGSLLGFFGFVMRKGLPKTPMFMEIERSVSQVHRPLVHAIIYEAPMIMKVILINVFISIMFYVLFVWMPSYIHTFLDQSFNITLLINTFVMLLLLSLIPVAGYLADKIGWKKQALFGVVAMLIFAFPLFYLITSGSLWEIITAQVIFVVLASAVEGIAFAIIADLFSTAVRYSGLVIGYNLSTAIFGGTAPFLCTYLIYKTGSLFIPAIFLVISSIVSLPAFLSLSSNKSVSNKEEK